MLVFFDEYLSLSCKDYVICKCNEIRLYFRSFKLVPRSKKVLISGFFVLVFIILVFRVLSLDMRVTSIPSSENLSKIVDMYSLRELFGGRERKTSISAFMAIWAGAGEEW